jgi:hypothetical protein
MVIPLQDNSATELKDSFISSLLQVGAHSTKLTPTRHTPAKFDAELNLRLDKESLQVWRSHMFEINAGH